MFSHQLRGHYVIYFMKQCSLNVFCIFVQSKIHHFVSAGHTFACPFSNTAFSSSLVLLSLKRLCFI